MKAETLTSSGESLRDDFQQLIREYATGWGDEGYLIAEDIVELCLIEDARFRILGLNSECIELEQSLTSGFFPSGLTPVETDPEEPSAHGDAVASRQFSEPNSRTGGPAPWPPPWTIGVRQREERRRQEGARSEEEPDVSERDEPRPVKGLKDLARFLESKYRQEREAKPDSGMAENQSTMRGKIGGEEAISNEHSLSLSLPQEIGALAAGLSSDRDDHSPLAGEHAGSLKGDRDLSRSAAMLRKRGPSGEEWFSPLFPEVENSDDADPFPIGDDIYRKRDAGAQMLKGPGLKAIQEASFKTRKAKREDEPAWDHNAPGNYFYTQEEQMSGQADSDPGEKAKLEKGPDRVSALDLDDIVEALAREIEREYRRFYGN